MWADFCDIYSPLNESKEKDEFRLIIAGTRSFNDYNYLKQVCDYVLSNVAKTHKITIISGTANGADKLGERYAKEKGYKVVRFPAKWNRQPDGSYDKSAGYKRNNEMAIFVSQAPKSGCLIFWDGISRGAKNMIEIAKRMDINCIVKQY